MFDFLMDMGNYEDRCIDRSEFDWGYISTARVSDGSKPYETAVCSDEYAKADDPNDTSKMIIVEAYDSKEKAQKGHAKWTKNMTKNPPDKLTDCCNAGIAALGVELGAEISEIRICNKEN